MKSWQFRINGRAAGPVRRTWLEAVGDAIRDGFTHWVQFPRVIRCDAGAEVVRLNFGQVEK